MTDDLSAPAPGRRLRDGTLTAEGLARDALAQRWCTPEG